MSATSATLIADLRAIIYQVCNIHLLEHHVGCQDLAKSYVGCGAAADAKLTALETEIAAIEAS